MSTSLTVMPQGDPRDRIIEQLRSENSRLQRELESERQEVVSSRKVMSLQNDGLQNLRTTLDPLFQSLKYIYGEMERSGFETVSVVQTKNSAAWEQWKQRLGGATARAIDALMVHGEMNQTQLRIILGCATRTVTNVVAALNQAKLIDKRDGKIRLKEL